MNRKKIFAIAILVLAVFCCLSVASAGFLDFLGGGSQTVNNKTVSFDGFTLQLPEDTTFNNRTPLDDGQIKVTIFEAKSKAANMDIRVTTTTGPGLIHSAQRYADNMVDDGGAILENHSGWIVLDLTHANQTETPMKYLLTLHDGSCLITIEGNNVTELERIADTYQKA